MKILQTRLITFEKYLNLYERAYIDRNGTPKNWVFASRRSPDKNVNPSQSLPDAVIVVPYHTSEKKLVVIREFRVALGGYQYGFPAGLVDPGESVAAAGERELKEETGLEMTRVIRKSPVLYSSSGLTDESVCLLFAECEGVPETCFNEPSEDIEVLMVSQNQAEKLINNDQLMFDVKTWIVLDGFVRTGGI